MKNKLFIFIVFITSILPSVIFAQDSMPNREERIYSLSQIWKELQYNFAFPETLKKVNIDSLYLAYIPKVEQVKNNYEYYRTLSSFITYLDEAHTRIYVSHRPDDIPPIKATNFGEKIIVSGISKEMLENIPLGSEIIKINNIPVVEYIKDSVYPYISAATPHWKFDKAVTEMFYGVPQTTVQLNIKTPQGKEREVKMVRNYNTNITRETIVEKEQLKPIEIKILKNNIGYIKIPSFTGTNIDTIYAVFSKHLTQLQKCKGLIIDVRGNRGGTDQAWEKIAYHLISEPEIDIKGKWFSKKHIPTYKIWGEYVPQLKEYYLGTAMEEIKHSPYQNKLNDSLKLHQPLVVLSGQYVGSAAEDFLLMLRGMKRATIIGEPSVGAVSEPLIISLTGNYNVMIASKKYVSPDGTQPNKTGILPDIEVKRDYNLYMKGRDNILEQAVVELQKQITM